MRRVALRKKGVSETSQVKDRIQALLREHVIVRDGGCVLRHYSEAGRCGGWRKDGGIILQAEHLNGRSHSVSFGDLRNVVCLCKNHHFFFKKRESLLYWELIREHIGEKNWEFVQRCRRDTKAHRFTVSDWIKIEVALKQELKVLYLPEL